MQAEFLSFESIKDQLAEQRTEWTEVCRALNALDPAASVAVAPQFFEVFDAACAVTSFATASAPMPTGIRG